MAFSATAARTVLELATDSSKFYSSAEQARVRQVRTDVEGVGTHANKSAGLIGKIGPAIGAAFTVGAIVTTTKKLLDFAGATVDTAAKLGLSTSAVQKFDM